MSGAVKKDSTDVSRYIMLRDSSDGTPETGYTITNLDLQYTRERSTPAAKVDATALAATNSAHADNKAIEIDSTSSPGLYRVDWPDAAFATGVDKVILVVSGTGLDPAVEEVPLVGYDPEDSVRLGLTALPNAAADAAGGLPISDAGGLDLDGRLDAAVSSRLAPTTAARTLDVNANGEAGLDLDNTSGTIDAAQLGADCITAAKIADDAISSEHLNTGCLTADAFAADALVAATFATGAFTADVFAADALVAATFATDSIAADALAADAIAEINATVDTALSDIKLDHLISAAAAEDEVADNSIIARLAATEGDWSEFNDENHSLEAIRVQGDAAWTTATSVTVSDKTGFKLAADGLDSVTLPADLITAASINTGAFTADAFAADAIVAATLATGAITADAFAADAIVAATLATGCLTADAFAADALVAATFATDSIAADALAADALAEINAQVDTALSDINLDHLLKVALADDGDIVDDSALAQVMASDGDFTGYSKATDSLEALRDNQAAAADAVLMQNTTITVTDQTHFTLAAGSADDDAYNNMIAMITDQTTAEQKSVRTISDYTGSTKTVTIDSAPDFVIATGDTIDIIAVAPGSTPPTAAQIVNEWETQSQADPTGFHVNVQEWLGVAPLALSSQQVQAVVPETQKVDVETIKTQAVTCGAGVTVGAYVGNATAALSVSADGRVDVGLLNGSGQSLLDLQPGLLGAL
jgi:hypothetical protein